jgi:hypothetical protein
MNCRLAFESGKPRLRYKKEVTFLKKSNQKTFALGAAFRTLATSTRSKGFFAAFFSKKAVLTSFRPAQRQP